MTETASDQQAAVSQSCLPGGRRDTGLSSLGSDDDVRVSITGDVKGDQWASTRIAVEMPFDYAAAP